MAKINFLKLFYLKCFLKDKNKNKFDLNFIWSTSKNKDFMNKIIIKY